MSYSQADLDRLKSALAKGVTSVEVDGQRITYRSVAELRQAISMVESELQAATTPSVTLSFASFSRD